MGRRKIEIKAIKDDRNRSVTFLKRKGGLFKKAHELSVLCSVDVAVVIFGQNKKLYEFSSGDINQTLARYQYYGVPHEHKGPADFADKGGGDDDDDDDEPVGTPPPENASPPHHGMVNHPITNQPGYHHMRQSTPSASPPMPNGMYQHRMSTPQPHDGSRPSSRTTHIRRQSSNLVPQQHQQHSQNAQSVMSNSNYSYQQMPSLYQNQPAATANMHVSQQHPAQSSPPMPHHHYSHPLPPQQNHMQHLYMQDQRRSSMPSNFPGHAQVGQAEHSNMYSNSQQQRHPFQSPPLPEPQHPMSNMNASNSYFSNGSTHQDISRQTGVVVKHESQGPEKRPSFNQDSRSQSVDTGAAMRNEPDQMSSQSRFGPPAPPVRPMRTSSTSVITGTTPSSRVNSLQSDAKRPRLTVQIPGEQSEGSGASGESETSPKEAPKIVTPAKTTASESGHSSGLVLPAPSPRSASAGAILSAGATGPTNPFARPNLPSKHNSTMESFKENMASPMSALPSRVMAENGFMSSPSSMFPELNFGHGSNNLASPAVYQPTPIQMHGPSFRDENPDKKRKSPDNTDGGPSKKTKT